MTCPYYEDDLVTLYLGDCRDVDAWLSADVLVTDPPYGIAWSQPAYHGGTAHPGIVGDGDTSIRDWMLDRWGHQRPAVAFGHLKLPPPTGTRQVLVYQKASNSGIFGAVAGWRRDLEAIYLLGEWPAEPAGDSSLLRTHARAQGGLSGVVGRAGHPHAKPLDVMQEILAHCPPGIVADPFAGSGSTLVAAKLAGRRAIGVEIDERYCEAAARRLAQGVLDMAVTA